MKKVTNPWIVLDVFIILTVLTTGCIERPTLHPTERYKYPNLDEIENIAREPLPTYNDLQSARSDYQWKLDLVTEQTQRLDMYYALKSGVSMTQREYKAWLDDLSSQTTEFIKRNLEAIKSGNAYIELLNAENKRFSAEYTSGIIDYIQYREEYDSYSRDMTVL